MGRYITIASSPKGSLKSRMEDLFWKINSAEGYLYSLGAAVSELRKEYTRLKDEFVRRQDQR